jgi:DNA-directed RNA polymerase specialized sigma24 family protein
VPDRRAHGCDRDDFWAFAAEDASALVRLAHALTGDVSRRERLVTAALVETLRSWPRALRLGPQVFARRALVRALPSRSAAFARPRPRLQLQDVVRGDKPSRDEAAHVEELVWQGMFDLSDRQRALLALHFGAGLSLATTARVLRLPVRLADWLQRRAMQELRLAADLGAAPVQPDRGEADAAVFEASLRTALAAHLADAEIDVRQLLDAVLVRTSGTASRSNRSRSLAVAAVLLTVAAVAVGFLVGSDRPGERAFELPAASGSQLFGYRSLAVAVPAGWQVHESRCGRRVEPPLAARSDRPPTDCSVRSKGSSVTFHNDLFDPLAPLRALPRVTSHLAGHVVLSTGVARTQGGIFQQTTFVPRERFVMTVRSPDQALVAAITGSLVAVPAGFAVVPRCESLPVRDAVAALTAVNLTSSISHSLSLSTWRDEPPVIFQNKPTGAVVPDGTVVALTIPGR